ncbi:phenazine-specific anthranilate synthase component I [Planosporangium thailandense]|uniref:anthranilate synthase n=1 Tax=Planosporangium thailandense TaxID=765197 RepID=A0ABX0XXC8_9ACTN|nr:anthranilate synthase family protein [Planosporangium thailandense]NJC70696.1 phenazine-specific anthranilate synthase component I [Planosporangium thailandense]
MQPPVPRAELSAVLAGRAPAFALLHRPGAAGADRVEVLTGTMSTVDKLADLPIPSDRPAGVARHDLVALVPYRQLAERGFDCPDDGAPLLVMSVQDQSSVPVAEALRQLPDAAISLTDAGFDIDDEEYGRIVRQVLTDEIGNGVGSNFVVKRSYTATLDRHPVEAALILFRRLLATESSAYWTFLVHTGDRTFVGASPERHVSLTAGTVVMNPISGTYRYPAQGPDVHGVLRFLADTKEADELYMVVDEELKMMARMCDEGGRVHGPYLKEMARLAHTEYLLTGRSGLDVRDVLRETMFAPTVIGSPVESACRVVARYEPHGRGYYSGVVAVVGRDASGAPVLDSSILIRTAEIDADRRLRIGVGATLVRESDPQSEIDETRTKAAALLAAVCGEPGGVEATDPGYGRLSADLAVSEALGRRNRHLSRFWLADPDIRARPRPEFAGQHVLIVDAEDTFTAMLSRLIAAFGLTVTVRRFDEAYELDGADLVVLGPGPGDPREAGDQKITAIRALAARLLGDGRPCLAVCLGHQILSSVLGFALVRRERPNQGVQREIDLFGSPQRVGFYNSFAATVPPGAAAIELGDLSVCADPGTGEVHALRGPTFRSMQFHPESVLTEDGVTILGDVLAGLLPATTGATR